MSTITMGIHQCLGSRANTGGISCDFDIQDVAMIIATPANKEFDSSEIQAMDATLIALNKDDNYLLRAYPIGKIIDFTENTPDPTTEETGKGNVYFVRNGKPTFDIRLDVGTCGYKNLYKQFHNKPKNFRFILVDPSAKNNAIIGVKTSSGNFAGFTLEQLLVMQYKMPTGSTRSNTMMKIGFDDQEAWVNATSIQFGPETKVLNLVRGLNDFSYQVHTSLDAGLVKLKVLGPCGMEDLFGLYATNLAQVSAYVATNKETGLGIAITTATQASATKTINLQLNAADPNYPVSGGYIVIKAAAPSVLESAPISMPGFEGGSIELLVP